jgi:hypothetical protein
MSSLRQRIAIMSKLIGQLQELSQLRDQVRRTTLSPRRLQQIGRRKRTVIRERG